MMMRLLGVLWVVGCAAETASESALPEAPPPGLTLTGPTVVYPGYTAEFTVDGAAPGAMVALGVGAGGAGAGPCPPSLGGACLGIRPPIFIQGPVTAATGSAVFSIAVPPTAGVGRTVALQGVAHLSGRPTLTSVITVDIAAAVLGCTDPYAANYLPDATHDDGSCLADTRRIFLTSTVYSGDLGGLAGADATCQARADAANLGGTWRAILSTRQVDARDHVDGSFPRVNVDGSPVLGANEMFSDSPYDGYALQNPILDEFGQPVVGNLFPFAGGGPDGRKAQPSSPYGLGWDDACEDWTSTQGTTTCGYNNSTDSHWLSGCGGISCAGYVSGVGIHCAED
jgi:hypothetical protein